MDQRLKLRLLKKLKRCTRREKERKMNPDMVVVAAVAEDMEVAVETVTETDIITVITEMEEAMVVVAMIETAEITTEVETP